MMRADFQASAIESTGIKAFISAQIIKDDEKQLPIRWEAVGRSAKAWFLREQLETAALSLYYEKEEESSANT